MIAGITLITFRSSFQFVLATTTLTVSDMTVNIQAMSVKVITGLTASIPIVTGVTGTVDFKAASLLNQELQEAYVQAVVSFNDGTDTELRVADGLLFHLPSPDPNIFLIVSQSQQKLKAISGGKTKIFATWYSIDCMNRSTIVAASCADINVSLPSPTSVSVIVPAARLTLIGDAAAEVVPIIPTSSTITVNLVFPTYSTTYTNDPRTIYDLSGAQ
jgi:Transmembrane protein family 132